MIKQRTKEWFDQRKGRITASNAGALLGLSPFKTQQQAIKELKDPVELDDFTKDTIMRYGTEMEPHAVELFRLENTMLQVQECGFFIHKNWLGASPDGIVTDSSGNKIGLLEMKAPWSLRNKENPEFKSIYDQPHYYAQLQIQMHCTDIFQCFFYQYANGKSKLEIVDYDSGWIKDNLEKLHDIWKLHIRDKSDGNKRLSNKYFSLNKKIKELTKEKAAIMEQLKQIAPEGGIIGNGLLKVSTRKGSVDYKKAFKEHNISEDDYRKESTESWSFKEV